MSAMLLLQIVGSYKISRFGSLSYIEMPGRKQQNLATFFFFKEGEKAEKEKWKEEENERDE